VHRSRLLAMAKRDMPRSVLVTDLDNTVWDWFAAWHAWFGSDAGQALRASGLPVPLLENEARDVHQARATAEYTLLVDELPSLIEAANGEPPRVVFDEALHVMNRARLDATGVRCVYEEVSVSGNEGR